MGGTAVSQTEALAEIVREWGRAAGLELEVIPRVGVEVRIGPAERHPGYVIPPPVEGESPPEPVVVSGAAVEGYFVARRPTGGLVVFRRAEAGTYHRCETGVEYMVLGRLLCRVAYDRARARRDALMQLLDLLGAPGDWPNPLPPNPIAIHPKQVLTAEEKAERKAAKAAKKSANGEAVIATPPVAKNTPGPTVPVKGPKAPPKPKPRPQPSPSAALTALADRVKARETTKA